MIRFSPQLYYQNNHKSVCLPFATYEALKKQLKAHIASSDEGEVCVTRYRRGEWGEWFEYWALGAKGKPVIVREGWM